MISPEFLHLKHRITKFFEGTTWIETISTDQLQGCDAIIINDKIAIYKENGRYGIKGKLPNDSKWVIVSPFGDVNDAVEAVIVSIVRSQANVFFKNAFTLPQNYSI